MANFLTQKYGPLPAWAYGAGAGGIVLVILLLRKKSAGGTTDAPKTGSPVDFSKVFGGGTLGFINPVASTSVDKSMHKKPEHKAKPPRADAQLLSTTGGDQDRMAKIIGDYIQQGITVNGTPAPQFFLTYPNAVVQAITKDLLKRGVTVEPNSYSYKYAVHDTFPANPYSILDAK